MKKSSLIDFEIQAIERILKQMHQCLAIFLLSDNCKEFAKQTINDIRILRAEQRRLEAEKDAKNYGVLSKRSGKAVQG